MTRHSVIFWTCTITMRLCFGAMAQAQTQLPVVSLTAPVNGATYSAPATITLTATASDRDGYITRVEFYQGANKLGESYTAPYRLTISGVPAFNYTGVYAFSVKAYDNAGG